MYYDINKTKSDIDLIVSNKLKETFLLLASAIFVTIITVMLFMDKANLIVNNIFLIIIGQFVLISFMTMAIFKLSKIVLTVLLYAYAILTGLTLSVIIIFYPISSVIYVLLGTMVLFLTLAIYGYVTKKDLVSYSSFLTVGIVAIIILSIVNIFIGSSVLDLGLSLFGVFVFMIYTAYDVNQLKKRIYIYANSSNDLMVLDRISIIGAVSLYIDFINLFIYLLRLFGKRND